MQPLECDVCCVQCANGTCPECGMPAPDVDAPEFIVQFDASVAIAVRAHTEEQARAIVLYHSGENLNYVDNDPSITVADIPNFMVFQ